VIVVRPKFANVDAGIILIGDPGVNFTVWRFLHSLKTSFDLI
jgi:hypothetical protein